MKRKPLSILSIFLKEDVSNRKRFLSVWQVSTLHKHPLNHCYLNVTYAYIWTQLTCRTSNKWTRKYLKYPTKSFELSLIGFLFLALMRSMIKPGQDHTMGERTEEDDGDWTTSTLLSLCISLHVAVSFVCKSKSRWMGVNWNQFLLSDTINGVAQTG